MKKVLTLFLSLILVISLMSVPASALTLDDARTLLQLYYVDEIPGDILNLDSLDEILAALGDPYTVYMTAEEYEAFLNYVNGEEVVGIGVSISTAYDNGFQILSILDDSPALEAGLQAGDTIIGVDGNTLTATSDIQGAIQGEEGTEVTVTVRRISDGAVVDITMARRRVPIPIITYRQEGNVGIIDCDSFGDSTAPTFEEALTELNDKVDLWIVDLRSNPGGTVASATGSCGLFVGPGLDMIFLRDSRGEATVYYTTDAAQDLTDKPVIVLTSSYSASGAEVFAGNARDYGYGIGVGQRTFGKGIAQTVFEEGNLPALFDGDCMKITTDRFFSGLGTTNHLVGVLPTLLVSVDNTAAIAELLCAPEPASMRNHLKLEIGGFTFWIDLNEATSDAYKAAFTELLEAIPPEAVLTDGSAVSTPEAVAERLGLPFTSRSAFPDLEGVPQADKIRTLATYYAINGFEDGRFHPDTQVSRAEFCAMLARSMGLPTTETPAPFTDVDQSSWYASSVNALYTRGFINGCGNGLFCPDAPVTLQEAVKILAAAASWTTMDGFTLDQEGIPEEETASWTAYAPWAQESAWLLTELGMELDSSNPGERASRAVSAGLIYDMMDVTGLFWGI